MSDPWATSAARRSPAETIDAKRMVRPHASTGGETTGAAESRLRLVEAAVSRNWSEVERLLGAARGTLVEEECIEALGAFADEAPDRLRMLLSRSWIARGEYARAIDTLSGVDHPGGLVMLADLLRDGQPGRPAGRTELEQAYALYGKALRADWTAPGVHERWERLGLQLGLRQPSVEPGFGATLVAKAPSVPFTLLREVARGGSGTVFEARERLGATSRIVALKIVHDPAKMREQLLHEARTAVSFRGPFVVRVHDVDPVAGWLSLEWLGGGSLARPLVSFDRAFVLASLREVLGCLHAAGWVHGDVKPSNVLLDARARPVLADFGLARPIGAANTPGTAGFRSAPRLAGAPCAPVDDLHALDRIEELLSTSERPKVRS